MSLRRTHRIHRNRKHSIPVLVDMPVGLLRFLEAEAKRLQTGKRLKRSVPDVIRALVTAYYERRVLLGTMITPDD